MFFILSQDQHNKLTAIAEHKKLKNAHEALDWALDEAAGPLMEAFEAQRKARTEQRREAFANRKKSIRAKNYRRPQP